MDGDNQKTWISKRFFEFTSDGKRKICCGCHRSDGAMYILYCYYGKGQEEYHLGALLKDEANLPVFTEEEFNQRFEKEMNYNHGKEISGEVNHG